MSLAQGPAASLEHPPSARKLRRLLQARQELPCGLRDEGAAGAMAFELYLLLESIQSVAHGERAFAQFANDYYLPKWTRVPSYEWNLIPRYPERGLEHAVGRCAPVTARSFRRRGITSPSRKVCRP